MSAQSTDKNTKKDTGDIKLPNPGYYVGKVLVNDNVAIIGSMAAHTQDLADLKTQKLHLDLAQAEYALSEASGMASETTRQDLLALQTAFTEQAHKELLDLYLEGATSDGAAISEQDFSDLHTAFTEIVSEDVDLKELGYNTDIEPGALNEALTRIDIPDGTSTIARHNAVQEANTYMHEKAHDGAIFAALGGAVSGAGTLVGMLFLSMLLGNKIGNIPAHISINRRKRHAPKGMKH